MYYNASVDLAFDSVQYIMRDVQYGWFMRYLHSNGASFFFLTVYFHIWRNLYYKFFSYYHRKVWISGLIIFFFMIITAFTGYVLPWGQMSFWAATVITNLLSIIPFIGTFVVTWLWGGFSVGKATLSRFFSFHFILPFIILILIFFHLYFLHQKGSSAPFPFFSESATRVYTYLPLYPYFFIKDFYAILFVLFFFIFFVFFAPNLLSHTDNYIEADPMVTPEHIVPEWYFLPFYAILRSIPNKILGVITMLISILILFFLPYLDKFLVTNKIKYYYPFIFLNLTLYLNIVNFFVFNFILLGWLGAQPLDYPYTTFSIIFVYAYFILILLLPFFSSFSPYIFQLFLIKNKKL